MMSISTQLQRSGSVPERKLLRRYAHRGGHVVHLAPEGQFHTLCGLNVGDRNYVAGMPECRECQRLAKEAKDG